MNEHRTTYSMAYIVVCSAATELGVSGDPVALLSMLLGKLTGTNDRSLPCN